MRHFDSKALSTPGIDKVVFEKRLVVDEEDSAAVSAAIEHIAEEGDLISYTDSSGKKVTGKEKVLSAMASSSKSNQRQQQKKRQQPTSDNEPDEEMLEFFEELSKGRGFMTLQDLSDWDELQAIIDGGLADPKIVERYLQATPRLPGNKIDLTGFAFFMRKLDAVLLDSGEEDSDTSSDDSEGTDSIETIVDEPAISDEKKDAINEFRDWLGKDIEAMEDEEHDRLQQQFEELAKGKDYVTAKQLLDWDYLQEIVEELDEPKIMTMLQQELPDQKFDLDAFTTLMDDLEEMLTEKELQEMNEEEGEDDDEDEDENEDDASN